MQGLFCHFQSETNMLRGKFSLFDLVKGQTGNICGICACKCFMNHRTYVLLPHIRVH